MIDEPADAAVPGFIVDDDAATLGPGQIRKTAFLASLRLSVRAMLDEALAATEWHAEGCPWIDHWFAYYATKDAVHVERVIHRYTTEAASARSAEAYATVVTARVRRAVDAWVATGALSDVPEGVSLAVPGGAAEDEAAAAFLPRPGASPSRGSVPHLQAQLGEGRSLEPGLRGPVESAFGADLSDVRVHTDGRAATLADRLGARAFTVGTDVAFGAGEYRPGTPAGDAVIAHELAHVQQQRGWGAGSPASEAALERDADIAAADVVLGLWGRSEKVIGDIVHQALPRLRSGLRLQRCSKSDPAAEKTKRIADLRSKIAVHNQVVKDSPTRSVGDVAAAIAQRQDLMHDLQIEEKGFGLYRGTKSADPGVVPAPKATDCTQFVVDVLRETFAAKGQATQWDRAIKAALASSGSGGLKGTELMKALQVHLGWVGIFWAADTKTAENEGEHSFAAHIVDKKGTYYDIPVDKAKSVTDYRPAGGTGPTITPNLARLQRVSFGLLAARGGKHMAFVIRGQVFELHWDKPATSTDVIEATALERWAWMSGAIVAPAEDINRAWANP